MNVAAKPKTTKRTASVDAFLKKAAPGSRGDDCRALIAIMTRATGQKPAMWGPSIVGFGSYHYVYESGREGDWPLVGFSPRKAALVLYIMAGFKRYDSLLKKLGKHRTGASCLYVNRLADVDLGVLTTLIGESVAHMRARYGD